MIEFKQVTKSFGNHVVLNNINLTFSKHKIYGVIGKSGAGKSTLVRMINGLEKPTQGVVTVDGVDINLLGKKELATKRKEIGMIFQSFNLLWSRTVSENIMLPLELIGMKKAERLQRAEELMDIVGLKDKKNFYPSELSGGQKQRVGIARSLATNPKILIADEITSALDPETTSSILNLLRDINSRYNVTIVMITHQMDVVKKTCDEVAVIDSGLIVEQGSVMDIFSKPKHATTKTFIAELGSSEDLYTYVEHTKKKYPEGKVLKLIVQGAQSNELILSEIIRKNQLEFNILSATFNETPEGQYGEIIVQFFGLDININAAKRALEQKNVEWSDC